MKDRIIYKAALESAKGTVTLALLVIGLCFFILACSWKWVFNAAAGPVQFTGALALDPGVREFVSVEGQLIPTPFTEQTTLKFKGIKIGPASTTTNYKMMMVDGQFLLVKLSADFEGKLVEGWLAEPSKEISEVLKAEPKWYPWMLVQGSYRTHMNLFVLIVVVVLPLAVLLLAYGLWRVAKPERCSTLRELKRFGALEDIIRQIEDEIYSNDGPGVVNPVTASKTWVVIWKPTLEIFAKSEVSGYGIEEIVKESKEGPKTECIVHFWVKKKWDSFQLRVSQTEATSIVFFHCMERIPNRLVDNVAEFKKGWRRQFLADVKG